MCPSPWFQHEWQAILRIADNHHFCVRAGRQFLRGFDPFPFEQLRANACRHDLLEVRNALGLDAFPLRFLLLLLQEDRKSTRLNSSHSQISYAVFCLKKKKHIDASAQLTTT